MMTSDGEMILKSPQGDRCSGRTQSKSPPDTLIMMTNNDGEDDKNNYHKIITRWSLQRVNTKQAAPWDTPPMWSQRILQLCRWPWAGISKKCHVLQNICNNVYFNSFIVFTPLWVFLWCDRLILLANVLGHTSQDISFGILKYNRLFRLAISSDCFELQQL